MWDISLAPTDSCDFDHGIAGLKNQLKPLQVPYYVDGTWADP